MLSRTESEEQNLSLRAEPAANVGRSDRAITREIDTHAPSGSVLLNGLQEKSIVNKLEKRESQTDERTSGDSCSIFYSFFSSSFLFPFKQYLVFGER